MGNITILTNIISLIIILFVFYKGLKNKILIHSCKKEFYFALSFSILICIFEIISAYINGKSTNFAKYINNISNFCYLLFLLLCGLFWIFYVIKKISFNFKIHTKILYIISIVPCAILIILLVLSFKFDLIFYINDDNIYCRGKLHFLHSLLLFLDLFFASILSSHFGLKIKNNYFRKEYLSYVLFVIPTFIAGILQLFIKELSTISFGISFGFLNLYIEETERRAYIDFLTGLNNRYKLNLSYKKLIEPYKTYLVMIDLNGFKKINDQYGHLVGDNALIELASCLASCANNDFICRYGGDEFIIIHHANNDDSILNLFDKIYSYIDKLNAARSKDSYVLGLTYGYSKFVSKNEKLNDVIERADKMLYAKKRNN